MCTIILCNYDIENSQFVNVCLTVIDSVEKNKEGREIGNIGVGMGSECTLCGQGRSY